jgi:phosphatidylglycerophosphate synthase
MLTVAEIKARTCKERDSWWTVLLVDPVAVRLTRFVAPVRWITPNRVTLTAFTIGLLAAACFAQGSRGWLVAGAVCYYVSFLLDCVDGKVARLNGTGSIFGMWLDYILDHVRIITCVTALFGGQYAATHNVAFLITGAGVLVLELFHYVNSQEIFQINTEMRTRLEAKRVAAGLGSELGEPLDPAEAAKRPGNRSIMQLAGDDLSNGVFGRIRAWLKRSRIRPHLVGGIEFQMAVLIVAPLTGAIIAVSAVAAGLMLFFELAVIYMIYRAAKSVTQQIVAIDLSGIQPDTLAFTDSSLAVHPRQSVEEPGRTRT